MYSVEDCIQYCKAEPKCQAFNFKTTRQCQLLSKKAGNSQVFSIIFKGKKLITLQKTKKFPPFQFQKCKIVNKFGWLDQLL